MGHLGRLVAGPETLQGAGGGGRTSWEASSGGRSRTLQAASSSRAESPLKASSRCGSSWEAGSEDDGKDGTPWEAGGRARNPSGGGRRRRQDLLGGQQWRQKTPVTRDLHQPEGKDRPAPAADGRGAGRQSDYLIDPIAFLKSTFSVFSNLPETCLLPEQVLELIVNEKPPNSARLFLNEDADKPSLPGERRLEGGVYYAGPWSGESSMKERMKERMSSISRDSVKGFLRRNLFVLFTVAAVALGVILGFTLRPHNLSLREIRYFAFPGELLMRMLQMLVLPLIVSSLVTGISSLDSKASGKMGMRAVVYYMVTTLIAIVIVIIIRPGKGSGDSPVANSGNIEPVQAADAFLDLVRNMFPPNLVEACFKQDLWKRSFLHLGCLSLLLKELLKAPTV
ncbi:hypothetical protein L3Q82_003315 [Scortum barcoo]|uniref:Uncharacterized protein n=1 Tax=Scortum barcoo TaxID=214431 RepID=A0ACB8VN07_9TELE|nr:hypothetical protein L3Q82_003315 [Scortum barcoo]